jgi:hypothetical protein
LQPRKAAWLLAHFVGDIHQPPYVGAAYLDKSCTNVVDPQMDGAGKAKFGIGKTFGHTTGGNDLPLQTAFNLHHYWDDDTVDAAMTAAGKEAISEFAQFLVHNPPQNWTTSGDAETWSAKWAAEALPLARQALARVDIENGKPGLDKQERLHCTLTTTLGPGYAAWAAQVSRDQLSKAGFRLAAILKAALSE